MIPDCPGVTAEHIRSTLADNAFDSDIMDWQICKETLWNSDTDAHYKIEHKVSSFTLQIIFFQRNLGEVCDEQGEQFHQDFQINGANILGILELLHDGRHLMDVVLSCDGNYWYILIIY